MKTILYLMGFLSAGLVGLAQVVPLKAANWVFRPGAAEFGDSAGVSRLKILSSKGFVVLKNMDFGDGTIEMDVIPTDPFFAQFYFRWQDSLEAESFYFRTQRGIGHPYFMEAVQYTPIMKGTMCWDMMEHFEGNATYWQDRPNHLKLVISGKRMLVFVNGQLTGAGSQGASAGTVRQPTLDIPELEGNTMHGTLAFAGQAIISNLVVKPGKTEGLSPVAVTDPTANDPRYLRHWQMTKPDSIPGGSDFSYGQMPGKETAWEPIDAERRGVINLTRRWVVNRSHQIVWLKTKIHADDARNATLRLGFLDEVWIMLNGRFVFVDKNLFSQPIAKNKGRLSLENALVTLPLQQGDNELLVGLGSNFYSWAIVARLDVIDGLTIERTADGR